MFKIPLIYTDLVLL